MHENRRYLSDCKKVAIFTRFRIESGGEPVCRLPDIPYSNALARDGVQRPLETPEIEIGNLVSRHIEADDLPPRMNARISAARARGIDFAMQQHLERPLKLALNRNLIRLTREPRKRSPVISNLQRKRMNEIFHKSMIAHVSSG